MTVDQLFSAVNLVAIAGWLTLAALPRRRRLRQVLVAGVIPGVLAVTYVALVVSHWGSPGSFSSLAGVAQLFSNRWVLLAGWIHYLAFDLLLGVQQVEDAQARGLPHVLILPSLFLTFMFGPAGWLLYRGVRRVARGLVRA